MTLGNGANLKIHKKNLSIIKVGILGLGSIAIRHLDYLKRKSFQIEIYYLNFQNTKYNNSFLKKNFHGIFYNSKNIKKNFFDVIFICTPSSKHISDYLSLQKFSKNFFIEKPLSLNNRDHKRIKKFNNFYVAYVLNHKKIIKAALVYLNMKKEFITKVDIICNSYLPNWRPKTNYKLGHTYNSELSGGILFELSHEFEYAYNLFGNYQIKKHSFISTNKIGKIIDKTKITCFSKKYNYEINFNLSLVSKKNVRICKVFFKNQILIIDLLKNKIFLSNNKNIKNTVVSFKDDDMYDNQIDFIFQKIINSKSLFEINNYKSSNFTNNLLSNFKNSNI